MSCEKILPVSWRLGIFVLVLVCSSTIWAQTYIKASNTDIDDFFAKSLDVSGTTIIVGAPAEDSRPTTVNGDQGNTGSGRGAAYVFVQDGHGEWSQQAYLKVSNPSGYPSTQNWGNTVAISGDTAVMVSSWVAFSADGPRGGAYIFVRDGTNWTEQQLVQNSAGESGDAFGTSVAIDGDFGHWRLFWLQR